MTEALTKPSKLSYVLVEFKFGADDAFEYYRITDKSSAVQMFGHQWDSVSDFKITLPVDVGTLGDAQAEMEMRLTPGFLTDISSEDVSSLVRVSVLEVVDSELPGSQPYVCFLYRGNLAQAFRNPGGHSESVKLVLSRELSRLQYPLGIPAMLTCQWVFTRRGCFLDASALRETGTVSAVSGKIVIVTGLADHSSDPTGRYWDKGSLERGGVRIQTFDWQQAAPTTFKLRAEPPASWVGQTVRVMPGCDRLYATCDQRYGNKHRFMGYGYGMPVYHPAYEDRG